MFSIFFCVDCIAQKPGDSKAPIDNTTFKGKRELRKRKRVQKRTMKLADQNERKSRKENNMGLTSNHKTQKKKQLKERKKSKPRLQKTKD